MRDVLADLLRHLIGEATIALSDRRFGSLFQVENRDQAVQHQRRHGGARDQQNEPRGDPSHGWSAARHLEMLAMMSRPPPTTSVLPPMTSWLPSSGTMNFVLTTRATVGHAIKMAGGSSWKILLEVTHGGSDVRLDRGLSQPIQCGVSRRVGAAEFLRVKEEVGPHERPTARALRKDRVKSAGCRSRSQLMRGTRPRCPCRRRFRTVASEEAAPSSRTSRFWQSSGT